MKVSLWKNDPLLRLLIDKCKISWWQMWLIYALIAILDHPVYGWLIGYFRSRGNVLGALDDWVWLVANLTSGAALWAFYIWSAQGMLRTIEALKTNNSLAKREPTPTMPKASFTVELVDDIEYNDFIYKMQRSFNRSTWIIIPLLASVSWMVFFMMPYMVQIARAMPSWASIHIGYVYFWQIEKVFANAYVVFRILTTECLDIFWIRTLFQTFSPNVRPSHPDKCGGLRPLGAYRIVSVYLIVAVAITLVLFVRGDIRRIQMGVVGPSPTVIAGLLLFYGSPIVLVPFLFFAPLWSTHQAMQDEKRKRLLAIHSQHTLEYQKAISEMQRGGRISKVHFDKLEKWQRLYDITESIPEWPFDASVLKRFWASWLTVIIAQLLSVFGESMLSVVLRIFMK